MTDEIQIEKRLILTAEDGRLILEVIQPHNAEGRIRLRWRDENESVELSKDGAAALAKFIGRGVGIGWKP